MVNKKILIVDDDPDIATSLSEYLQREGFDAMTANSALEGLEKITEDTGIVISDIMMPEMNGVDFLQRLMEISPQVKTIMVTGYPAINTLLSAKKYGAVDYIKKPYNLEDLRYIIEKLIHGEKDRGEKKKRLLFTSQELFNVINDRLKEKLLSYQTSIYSGKKNNLSQMLKKIAEETPDAILININNPLAPQLLMKNRKRNNERYSIIVVAEGPELDQIKDMLFAYGADDCILCEDSPIKIERVIEECIERVKPEGQDLEIPTEYIARCMFAQVYHGGYYCLKKDWCSYKGNWVVIKGREYKKCLIKPFLVDDLYTTELVSWAGEINGHNINNFKESLMGPIREGKKNIIVNAAFLKEVNFNVFELLSDAYHEIVTINKKGSINIINLTPKLLDKFEIFNLKKEIGFFGPRMVDAMASFGKWNVKFD